MITFEPRLVAHVREVGGRPPPSRQVPLPLPEREPAHRGAPLERHPRRLADPGALGLTARGQVVELDLTPQRLVVDLRGLRRCRRAHTHDSSTSTRSDTAATRTDVEQQSDDSGQRRGMARPDGDRGRRHAQRATRTREPRAAAREIRGSVNVTLGWLEFVNSGVQLSPREGDVDDWALRQARWKLGSARRAALPRRWRTARRRAARAVSGSGT